MFEQLNTLNCFTTITAIEEVNTGLSNQCFKVIADGNAFFAKKIASTHEASINILANKQGISPEVYYHDNHWLINPFIDGKNLALTQQPLKQKIAVAIKLMRACHQIRNQAAPLIPLDIINEQVYQPHFSNKQQEGLMQLAIDLTKPLTDSKNTVCCHGDLNFSNVLITANNGDFLVDFECACSAPIEYDLAMFIAVNNINNDDIALVIQCYQQEYSSPVNHQLLNAFLSFCYVINGLWYFNRFQICHQLTYKLLAKQQFNRLNQIQNNQVQQLFCRLGIKL